MKLINNILDNYYKEKVINYISEKLKMLYALNIKIEEKEKIITILAKPTYYLTYSPIFVFLKSDSFETFIDRRNVITNIVNLVDEISHTDKWKKSSTRGDN